MCTYATRDYCTQSLFIRNAQHYLVSYKGIIIGDGILMPKKNNKKCTVKSVFKNSCDLSSSNNT